MAKLPRGMIEENLDKVIEMIKTNELSLPELQRPSVWGSSKVPRLISSVYQDYPFGIFLLWTPSPKDRIRCRPFAFQKSKGFDTTDTADHYLIDGQQRLTSFYRALHPDGDLSVVFNLKTQDFSLADGRIRQMLLNPEEHHWYYLRDLLSLTMNEQHELLTRHADIGERKLETIFGNKGKLWRLHPENIPIAIYNIQHKTYADVAEIFERINLGTPVRKSQILLGKLSAVYSGIVSEVEDYLANIRDRHGSRFNLDLFITAFSTIATDLADIDRFEPRYLKEKPPVEKVQADLKDTFTALDNALKFIDKYFYIDTFKYFRSERTLIALAFLHHRFPDEVKDESYCNRIAHWAYCSLLAGHHHDFNRLRRDLATIRSLEEGEDPMTVPLKLMSNFEAGGTQEYLKWRIGILTDMESAISRNNLLCGVMYGLSRWKGAKSFKSLEPIRTVVIDDSEDDEDVVDEKTVNELAIHEHHIYPRSLLVDEHEKGERWLTKEWIFDLGNFTFLTGRDNILLQNPDIGYVIGLSDANKDAHMIGTANYMTGEYKKFLADRRKLIQTRLGEFLDHLKTKAEEG